MFAVRVALSLLLPVAAGWVVVSKVWTSVPKGLRLGLGIAVGMAMAGTTYFLALVFSDSAWFSLAATEGFLGAAIVISALHRPDVHQESAQQDVMNRRCGWIAAITLTLAGAAFLFALDSSRRGGWDAFAIWNLKARLLATANESPLSVILDRTFLGLHADYPLVLPSLVSRGWQYAGSPTAAVPVMLSALLTVAVVVVVIGGIRVIGTNTQSWISGTILAGTPFLLSHGASQYADIALCCFMTAAVVLYCVYDFDSRYSRLPMLAGILAAAAACTKNVAPRIRMRRGSGFEGPDNGLIT